MTGVKVLIYYNHLETMGHTTRVFNIARGLKGMGFCVAVMQGGQPQSFAYPRDIEVVDVPDPIYSKISFRSSDVMRQKSNPTNMRGRAFFIKNFIRKFNPDIILTEYIPLGRFEESFYMQSILRWAKKSNPSVIICSSVGYPVFMHPTKIERKVLEDSAIFDSIFIHTPPGEYTYVRRALGGDNLAAAERIMEGLRAKITYTNYIIKEKSWNTEENRTSIRDSLGLSGEKLVVSSRGGGAVSPKIIMDSILSMRRVGGCFMLACAGPSSSQREMDVFNRASAMANNVKVIGYTPSLERYIDACDVSIGLSGYNTSLEVLRSSKRSVLIPRANVEQSYRALMLKEMIGSSVIEHNRCSPEEIAREIGFQISRDPEVIPKTDPSMFNGIEVLGKGLRELKP